MGTSYSFRHHAAALVCIVFVLPFFLGCEKKLPTRDAVISGGSMAPSLLGEHYKVKCIECGTEFACGTKNPADNKVVCPNCGCRENSIEKAKLQPADKVQVVLMDEAARGQLQRGEIVAFKLTDDEESVAVKRVIGLPGEKIQIRHGDIFVDDKLFRKSIEQQKSWRIPVFDSQKAVKTKGAAERIEGTGGSEIWNDFLWSYFAHVHKDRYGTDGETPELEWATYRNWRCCRHDGQRTDEFPIEDYYAFNQDLNRNLHPTDELYFQVDVQCQPDAILFIAVPHSGVNYKLNFDFEKKLGSLMNPLGALGEFELSDKIKAGDNVIEVSTIDHRLVIIIDGTEVFRQSIFRAKNVADVAAIPVGLTFPKGTVKLNRLQIWRDVYYLNEGPFYEDGDENKAFVAGDDEFVLLGDNCPVSSDSRHWEKSTIDVKQIIGNVVSD